MKVIIMLRRFEIDSSLFYPKTVMQFPTLSLGSLKGDKKRSKLGVRGWVGYNLLKYLLSERRNLVMNDFYILWTWYWSKLVSKMFKSIYTQFGHRGMSFEKKKMFWFYNHKIKKWLLNDLGNTILNRIWSKLYMKIYFTNHVSLLRDIISKIN